MPAIPEEVRVRLFNTKICMKCNAKNPPRARKCRKCNYKGLRWKKLATSTV